MSCERTSLTRAEMNDSCNDSLPLHTRLLKIVQDFQTRTISSARGHGPRPSTLNEPGYLNERGYPTILQLYYGLFGVTCCSPPAVFTRQRSKLSARSALNNLTNEAPRESEKGIKKSLACVQQTHLELLHTTRPTKRENKE